MESLSFEEIKQKVEQFTDLKELPCLYELIECNARSFGKGEYMDLYLNIIPSRLNKLWFNGLLLDSKPLEGIIYDEIEPKLSRFLHNKGIDNQECFLYVYPQYYSEEYPDNWGLEFFMGFDLFETEKDECGWCVFKITITDQGYYLNEKYFEQKYLNNSLDSFYIDWEDGKCSNSNENIKYILNQTGKTFYEYKTPQPYKNLADYFSDGGSVLRLD